MFDQSILIIEDTPEMQLLLMAILGSNYRVKVVPSVRAAYDELTFNKYDLLLVDVDLPGESGFQFCANIKQNPQFSQIPLIFLTCHNQTSDIVVGFSLGAEDYITKPIVREQFEARILSRLRKEKNIKKQEQIKRSGFFQIDLQQQRVFTLNKDEQKEIYLTSIEFKLLKYFIDHQNHVLSREQILNDVWGSKLNVGDRTVDTHIYTLRKKLGNYSECIHTISGVGYQYTLESVAAYVA